MMKHDEQDIRPKASIDEIRNRFDQDVERFSNLDTGQTTTMDSPLMLDLCAEAAASLCPHAKQALDLGCGAGNYSLKLQQYLPDLSFSLNDLSKPMLDRATKRLTEAGATNTQSYQGDLREVIPQVSSTPDIIIAAMVLHHLRSKAEWVDVIHNLYETLAPNGVLVVADIVSHSSTEVDQLMTNRWGDYLVDFRDEAYRDMAFEYVAWEDTPWPLFDQLQMLSQAGFTDIDILHKNACFAAYIARK